jgi:Transposase DDE domain
MRLTIHTALNKAIDLVGTTIQQLSLLTKPQLKFFVWLIKRWWMLPVRYNFMSLSRYGGYSDRAIREQFAKPLPFMELFDGLYHPLQQKECILAFDPTFVPKSGKDTPGLYTFWNGAHQRAEKGLEAGVLALIDVNDRMAYHIEATQTEVAAVDPDAPAAADGNKGTMEQYARMITTDKAMLQPYSTVVVVDGYFMKKGFIEAMTTEGFEVVTKGRRDADLKYLYHGKQSGNGHPRWYSGKVNLERIDKRRWKQCYHDEEITAYQVVVYSVSLKCKVKAVYVVSAKEKGYDLLISTDVTMAGEKVLQYYRLRFQIEFLIRDAKQYAGLEQCQARSTDKLYNHWNMALFSVSLARWQWWAQLPEDQKQDTPFSMRSVKTSCLNQYMAETIFSILGLDMSSKKVKRLFNQCLNIGNIAA